MATKLYLHNAVSAVKGTLPVSNATVSATSPTQIGDSGTNRSMNKTIGVAQASIVITTNGTANAQPSLIGRFLSDRLAAQTFALTTIGDISLSIAGAEANAGSNFQIRISLATWRPSTGAVVTRIHDLATNATLEPGTTQTSLTATNAAGGTSASVADGDILICEIWRDSTVPGATTARTNTIFYDGTTEASITTNAAFINFPNDTLIFAPQVNGQAQAKIKVLDVEGFGQAQARIFRTEGYGQAQALIPWYTSTDTFTRTVSNGLGTNDSGQTWSVTTPSKYSVDGTKGHIANNDTTIETINLPVKSATTLQFSVDISANVVDSHTQIFSVYFHTSLFFYIRLNPFTQSLYDVYITNGSSSVFMVVNGTWVDGAIYRLSGRIHWPSGTSFIFEGKFWNTAQSEPAPTTITGNVESAISGSLVYINSQDSGGAGSTFVWNLDNFSITNNGWTQSGQAQARIFHPQAFGQSTALIAGVYNLPFTDNFNRAVSQSLGIADNSDTYIFEGLSSSIGANVDGVQGVFFRDGSNDDKWSLTQTLVNFQQGIRISFRVAFSEATQNTEFRVGTPLNFIFVGVRATGITVAGALASGAGTQSNIDNLLNVASNTFINVEGIIVKASGNPFAVIRLWVDGDTVSQNTWIPQAMSTFSLTYEYVSIRGIWQGNVDSANGNTQIDYINFDNISITEANIFRMGHAQAKIITPGIVNAQAQANIGPQGTRFAQAQAKIKSIDTGRFGQARATIRNIISVRFAYGAAKAYIKTPFKYGQALARIKQTYPFNSYPKTILNDVPQGYWRLGDKSGVIAVDSMGLSNGTYTNPVLAQPGLLTNDTDTAVDFNGTTAYLTIPNQAGYHIGSTGAITLEAWFKLDTTGGDYNIFFKGGSSFEWRVRLRGNTVNATVWDNGGSVVANFTTIATFVDTVLHHLAVTLSDTTDTINIYIDGVLLESSNTAWVGTPGSGTDSFVIGRRDDTADQYFPGILDEVAIYNKQLSPGIIKLHSQAGLIGLTGPTFAQAQALISTGAASTKVYGQAQADILKTTNAFAQSQADILATSRGYGQAQADIKATSNGYGQANADIKAVSNGYGQANADILKTTNAFAQAQADILATSRAYAQAQADIKQTTNVFAQAQADIKVTSQGFGQANADIKSTTNVFAQAQADIKATSNGYAQAQADIKQTYNSFAQAQADIKQTSRGYGQAQACIKGNAFGQAQADIKQTYNGFAQAQADIKVTTNQYGQSQADIKATSNTYAQANADIKAVSRGYGQAQADIKVTTNQFAQAQTWIEQTYNGFGQSQADIKQTYNAFAQAQAKINAFGVQAYGQALSNIKGIDIEGVGQAQAKINAFGVQGYGQAQSDIKQTYNAFGQAQATLATTSRGYAQAQADIKQTYNGFGQANSDIKATSNACGQVQADIKVTTNVFAQSQADIKHTYNSFAQSQADIKATLNGYGQAQACIKGNAYGQSQADIKQTYQGYGQSQADIKATSNGYGQSQSDIKAVGYGFGQANADIKATSNAYGQSQADIRNTYQSYGQSQADIKQTSNGYGQAQACIRGNVFGQSQADIKQTYQAFAQAQAKINAFAVKGYGQSQAYILSGKIATGQAQADVKAIGYGFGQSQSDIKAISRGYGQAQSDIKVTSQSYAQAQAQIVKTSQSYGQSQADIKTTYQAYVQANADIKNTYQGFGQAQSDIKNTYQGYGQANATIITTKQAYAQAQAIIKSTTNSYGQTNADVRTTTNQYGQAQSNIKNTYQAYGQSQGYIGTTGRGFGQAQSDIKHTYNSSGQAQSDILHSYSQYGNAQATIKTTNIVNAQAQAYIKSTINSYGQAQGYITSGTISFAQAEALILRTENTYAQAQAFISKSAGYGQARAYIQQLHQLKVLLISDSIPIGLDLNDYDSGLSIDDEAPAITLSVSDSIPISIGMADSEGIDLILDDYNY